MFGFFLTMGVIFVILCLFGLLLDYGESGSNSTIGKALAARKTRKYDKKIGSLKHDPRTTYQIDVELLINWEQRFKVACGDRYIPAATSLFPEMRPFLAEVVSPIIQEREIKEPIRQTVKMERPDPIPEDSFSYARDSLPKPERLEALKTIHGDSIGELRVRYPRLTDMMVDLKIIRSPGYALMSLVDAFGMRAIDDLESRRTHLSRDSLEILLANAENMPIDYFRKSEREANSLMHARMQDLDDARPYDFVPTRYETFDRARKRGIITDEELFDAIFDVK